MLQEPLRLQYFEFRGFLAGGRTRPLLVAALNDKEEEYQVVLKLRRPSTPIGEGHHGGTSLACELICSMLARANGLPVPDYAIVEIKPDLLPVVRDREVRHLLESNLGANFGSAYHEDYTLWHHGDRPAVLSLIDGLENVLSFDATVINGDRNTRKPNLLFRGESLLMIDHSLALPIYLSPEEMVEKFPLFPEPYVREHCSFQALAGKRRPYVRLFSEWKANLGAADLEQLRSLIPKSWEQEPGHLARIFSFLEKRPSKFDDISIDLRRIVK